MEKCSECEMVKEGIITWNIFLVDFLTELCLYMNEGTSLKGVEQIRQTDNLRSIIWKHWNTAKLNIMFGCTC